MIRDFWILLNEKYQRNKTVIWFIVIVLVLFLLVMRNMDKLLTSNRGSSVSSTTSESDSSDEVINRIVSEDGDDYDKIMEDVGENEMDAEKLTKLFVELCNRGNYETAYGFVSDSCKELKYPTLEDFKSNYIASFFKDPKIIELTEIRENTFKIKYKKDPIASGNTSDEGIVDYITIMEDGKINLGNFIERAETKIVSIAPIYTIYVDTIDLYIDKVVCNIRVKNNTKADIFINDIEDNKLFIKNYANSLFYVDQSELFENDYYVPAGKEKEIKISFNGNFVTEEAINSIVFNNIKVINKEYLDSSTEVTNPSTGEREYAKVKTNYPEKSTWEIKIKE